MTPNSDAPDTDAFNSADYYSSDDHNADDGDANFSKSIRFSLRNHNRKISPNTKIINDLQH